MLFLNLLYGVWHGCSIFLKFSDSFLKKENNWQNVNAAMYYEKTAAI